ncbi:hypothetical protein EKN06_02690 [Croceicoccus ponticola]|uniref:Holdfast attachment protein HfaA n=1 Tax=Croceicoccus ponticola TaxID=2217664 RepID=A0A437H0G6_9SPHN|nr:hypothetical protein [Croceicoccus ponticola]RVQ69131.1 hypothetical protein EKN06_02690 [Croceicoccus ponticola]
MSGRAFFMIGSGLLAISLPAPALAQDAAETAAILSGSSQTGGAQRSLGNSIVRSVNRASNAIAATRPAPRQNARRAQGGSVSFGGTLPADVDVLEGTDAATYKLGNGSSIRTTGRINSGVGTACVANCAAENQE